MSHERLEGGKQILRVRILVQRRRSRPFIAEAFTIYVQMRACDFLIVRIPMRWALEIKAHKDDDLPRTVLIGSFRKLDLGASDVEHEVLPPVRRKQFD